MIDSSVLSAEQVERYRTDGYLVIEDFTDSSELARLREIFQRRFRELGNGAPDTMSDRHAAVLEQDGQVRLQSVRDQSGRIAWAEAFQPELDNPELLDTMVFGKGLAIASQLLEVDVDEIFWESNFMLRTGNATTGTYWHQDEGFMDPAFDYPLITVWVALHETTPDCGMMHFVPGSHREGVLRHEQGARPGFAGDVPHDRIVACPLPAGGATIHSGRTLHYTNLAKQRRYNYIIRFNGPPAGREVPYERPWYIQSDLQRDKLTMQMFNRH